MSSDKHITSIGGQAIIEGVMMRGPSKIATAVRKPDGDIIVDEKPVASLVTKYKLNKIPIVRGVVSFVDSLITGVKALMFSAEFYDIEDEEEKEPSKLDNFLEKMFGDKLMDWAVYFSVILSLAMGIGLFMLLPTAIAGFFRNLLQNKTFITLPESFVNAIGNTIGSHVFVNLVEAVIRIVIFLVYMILVSKMKDIKRVFEYHGAEHKTIACYEAGSELIVENVKNYTRFHPRCGTSFLLIVMVVSILFFSFLSWETIWVRMGLRLLLLPVVAGVSYEIIKFAGRSKNPIVGLFIKPGLWFQKLTTREPDEAQMEVAIAAMKAVIPESKEEDKW